MKFFVVVLCAVILWSSISLQGIQHFEDFRAEWSTVTVQFSWLEILHEQRVLSYLNLDLQSQELKFMHVGI
jgi:hypothetical protein